MNEKAKELGMNDTNFVNCHGIDEDGHVTSAYDISLMSRELLLKYPNIIEYSTIYMDTLRDGKSQLVNTNKLLRTYNGCTGLKTGSTALALYNLAASATRNDLSLISVIMHAPSTAVRFNEAKILLDYGFANYSSVSFGNAGDMVATVSVEKGVSNTVNAILGSSASIVIKKGFEKNVVQNISLEDSVIAPVFEGQKIGSATFLLNDEIIATIDIVAESSVEKSNVFSITTNLYKKWFNLIR